MRQCWSFRRIGRSLLCSERNPVASTFKTNPEKLSELLAKCESGKLQLPDFQRSWVWDIDRLTSLLASVSKGFPVGALMALESGGVVSFHPRPIEGAASAASTAPAELLLDGQQRITSLYQAAKRSESVDTTSVSGKKLRRWFYFDMEKALDHFCPREEAIIAVPEDKMIRSDFGRVIELDLSSPAKEYELLHFPVCKVFNTLDWLLGYNEFWSSRADGKEKMDLFRSFNDAIIKSFTEFDIPVITLAKDTSKEAVCIVFEKVNTGGKPLDAFELITAIYASDGYELRKDWFGDKDADGILGRLKEAARPGEAKVGILAGVQPTDFLHVISLYHTRELRKKAAAEGKTGKELPQVTGTRAALLDLPLDAYRKYKDVAEDGFKRAAKFLFSLNIFRVKDLPYQSQIVPLAAILGDLKDEADPAARRAMLKQWYWCGVFGELYGSTTETRVAKDFIEVGPWLEGGTQLPSTVYDAQFRVDRLKSMRMRLSAAYKGVNALLMLEGSLDWRTGKEFGHAVFFEEAVDIHHVFPQKWCKAHGIDRKVYDSIINKTPLSKRTNIVVSGDPPSTYLERLEKGIGKDSPIARADLDAYIERHLIDPILMRADNFEDFMNDRQDRLIKLIERAIGKSASHEQVTEEEEEEGFEEVDELGS